jgi:hypothetical protein
MDNAKGLMSNAGPHRSSLDRRCPLPPDQTPSLQTRLASGHFEVKMEPQPAGPETAAVEGSGTQLGRMLLHKRFDGDLQGTGEGQMLTAVSDTPGSAGYVVIERFVGTLHGRAGSFVFQHSGQMDRGAQQLVISVVPGSGSGELAGLAGRFMLRIENGRHLYDFDYAL